MQKHTKNLKKSRPVMYWSWAAMKTRCLNKNDKEYSRYGGRGITVCEKWMTFKGFAEEMGDSYRDGLSIERIDNHGNYSKENCRWATPKEQAQNTRNVQYAKRFSFENQNLTIKEWAEKLGIKRTTLHMRLVKYGWPTSRALMI